MRGAAVLAISYVGYVELLEPLRRIAASDPDVSVREDAASLVEGMLTYPARSVLVE